MSAAPRSPIGRIAQRPRARCHYTDAPEGPGLSLAVAGIEIDVLARRAHEHALDELLRAEWRGPLPSLRPPVVIAYRRWVVGTPLHWEEVFASARLALETVVRLGVIPGFGPQFAPRSPLMYQCAAPSTEMQGFELALVETGAALSAVDLLAWGSLFRSRRQPP